jgi:hypothetical protein
LEVKKMAHFAKINKATNEVLHVSVVDNWNCVDGTGNEVEAIGIAYLEGVHGVHDDVYWKQTSYNNNIRKNYAGIGMTYDSVRDAFIAPKPYPSWVLVEATCQWKAPVDMPADANTGDPLKRYAWDEATVNWVEVTV